MKLLSLLVALLMAVTGRSQIITTVAGGGTSLGDGGPATSAFINNPGDLVFSKDGSLYIASGLAHRIRKIDPSGIITTIGGTGTAGYSGDAGAATAAEVNFPTGIALDTLGNVFFTDKGNYAIRKINTSTGVVTTICGNGTQGYTGDGGPASAAQLFAPENLCFDNYGNLYIAENSKHVVRKINASGVITTIAGTGTPGFNGDGIAATSAQLYFPESVQADKNGNIYVSDQGNYRIRKINTAGIISTYAGNGSGTYAGDGGIATNAQLVPTNIKFDLMQNLFVTGNYRVSKIDQSGTFHAVAGNGTTSNTGDGGPAIAASIYSPLGMAFDTCNNLYISVINYNRIRKIDLNPSCAPLKTFSENIVSMINIYPNPASNHLIIENAAGCEMKICDVVGREVYRSFICTGLQTVDVSRLEGGVYFVVFRNEARVKVMRVVKR